MSQFEDFAKKNGPLIDKTIENLLQSIENKNLKKSALYALEGGKRLRPLLLLATVASFSPKFFKKSFLPAACLEMIHAYSLIHDDLPCMDNDDLRRGKPSLHKAFPEWLSLLTGDFLLSYPFEVIAGDKKLSAQEKNNLIFCLSFASGGRGMLAGQIEDMSFEGKKVNWPVLKKMEEKKTAYLFMAALECGSILSHVSIKVRRSLALAGKKLGLAYQIIDDIVDAEEGKDVIEKKATAIAILGKGKAKQVAANLLKETKDLLLTMPKADLLKSFVDGLEKIV